MLGAFQLELAAASDAELTMRLQEINAQYRDHLLKGTTTTPEGKQVTEKLQCIMDENDARSFKKAIATDSVAELKKRMEGLRTEYANLVLKFATNTPAGIAITKKQEMITNVMLSRPQEKPAASTVNQQSGASNNASQQSKSCCVIL